MWKWDTWAVQASFSLGPARLVERRHTCGDLLTAVKYSMVLCLLMWLPVLPNGTEEDFINVKPFVAARFTAAVLRIMRVYSRRVYVPFICWEPVLIHGMDMFGEGHKRSMSLFSKLHGCLTRVHAAMETLALHHCLMVLKDFKETGFGCCNPYWAEWGTLNLNAKEQFVL